VAVGAVGVVKSTTETAPLPVIRLVTSTLSSNVQPPSDADEPVISVMTPLMSFDQTTGPRSDSLPLRPGRKLVSVRERFSAT
jgi:hypothetical protein